MSSALVARLARERLWPWQLSAVAQALSHRFALFSLVGSGKTITAGTVASEWIAQWQGANPGKPVPPVLLVGPADVLNNTWPAEMDRWEHTAHFTLDMAHRMAPAARRQAWLGVGSTFTTCTPDLLRDFVATVASAKARVEMLGVIVDEAHQMKRPESRRTQALLALCDNPGGRVLLLTGTPMANGPQDVWSMGWILSMKDRDFWGQSYEHYLRSRFVPYGDYGWRAKPGQIDLITAELARYAISIGDARPEDVPEPIYIDVPFRHPPHIRQMIGMFLRERVVEIDGQLIEATSDGAHLATLHQLTQGFAYVGGVTKVISQARIDALADVVARADGPVLVGVKYLADVEMIRARFPGCHVYNGSTSQGERSELIHSWNASRIPLLVASPAAAGVGLNLQHSDCKDLVWYCHGWDSAQRTQFEGRLVRQGQRHRVAIHSLHSTIGLDDSLLQVLARKGSGESDLLAALHIDNRPTLQAA